MLGSMQIEAEHYAAFDTPDWHPELYTSLTDRGIFRQIHCRKAVLAEDLTETVSIYERTGATEAWAGLACCPEREIEMPKKTVLTSAELAYINDLVSSTSTESGEARAGFNVDGGEKANGLLLQLAAKANLTLEAELEDYCMSFPLKLTQDEFQAIHLRLAPPTIYERGPVLRAWRLHLDEPLPLLSDDGNETALSVHELSPNGLLVDVSPKNAPKHLHMHLALPGEGSLEIDAHRIRDAEGGMTAYEVEYPQDRDAERIRSYLYEQHQRLHPELQPELPSEMLAATPEPS
ncbi:PilZ domain-containing protein [Stutzerimonas zhaodongensis]|uniref:PilZ domain-containing protein n=1 Tax=Stutzerimonas zhaodongensis TaxID=1176257 RepID=UPI0039EE90EA